MPRWRGPCLARVLPALMLLLAGCGSEPGSPRLILLLSVDTLRADRLAAYGGADGLTPNLDALAAQSVVFEAAYAPATHTLPSMSALLTGLYPEQLGVWSNESVLPDSATTLAEIFRERGWRTAAVVSNWVLRAESGLGAGFAVYDENLTRVEAGRNLPERIAVDTTDAALRALDLCTAEAARCLLWVHYQDPHGPYTPPPEARSARLAGERARSDGGRELPFLEGNFGLGGIPTYQVLDERRDVAFYRAGYDAEIAYTDAEIGRLLRELDSRGLAERSVVVFTADHGESLGENDYWFSHGELLTEPLVHVPLLFRVPGRPPQRRSDLASLVDLQPTLVELVLGEASIPESRGRALLKSGAESGESVPYLATLRGSSVPRFGLIQGDFKYVVTLRNGVWDGRLLKRGDDGIDLTAPAPHVANAMRDELRKLRAGMPRATLESRGELSSGQREKLQSLGYLDPSSDTGS